ASVVSWPERDSGRALYMRPSRMRVPLGVSKTASGYACRVALETNRCSSSTNRRLSSGRAVRTPDPADRGRCSSSSQAMVNPSISSIPVPPARARGCSRRRRGRAVFLLRGCVLQLIRLVQVQSPELREHPRNREGSDIDLIQRHPPPHSIRACLTLDVVMKGTGFFRPAHAPGTWVTYAPWLEASGGR